MGTPPDEDGSADLKYVLEVAKTVGMHANNYLVFVTKVQYLLVLLKVKMTIQVELDKRHKQLEFDVASNPEFLKEGNAIEDFETRPCYYWCRIWKSSKFWRNYINPCF